jgi:hypothetical protein
MAKAKGGAKGGLSNAVLGLQVLPRSFMTAGWFGVAELSPSFVAEGESQGYVRVPAAFVIASDGGKLYILKAGLYENGDMKPGRIIAAWTDDGTVKVAVTAHDGEVKEFFLSHLRIVGGDKDAAS